MKKKRGYNKRRWLPLFILVLCSLCMTGCGNAEKVRGSKKAQDGRSYGGTVEGNIGEVMHTAFFDVTLDQAVCQNTYQFEDGLYQADSGNTYLIVTLTIENTYEKDLPMSITDFTLDFDGRAEDTLVVGFGKAELGVDPYMEDLFTLKQGEHITKSILFTVDEKEEYTLCYKEYYEDQFEGNRFEIHFTPEAKQDTLTTEEEAGVSQEDAETLQTEGESEASQEEGEMETTQAERESETPQEGESGNPQEKNEAEAAQTEGEGETPQGGAEDEVSQTEGEE